MSTLHYYYHPQNCLYQDSLFPSFDPKMNFHRLFTVRGPGSPEKSLGTNPRRAGFRPAVKRGSYQKLVPHQPWDPCPQVSRRCQTASRTARIAAGPAPAPRSYSAGAGQPGWPRWECRRRARGACCWASAWSRGCRGTVSSLRREVSTSEWVGAEQTSPAASFPSNQPSRRTQSQWALEAGLLLNPSGTPEFLAQTKTLVTQEEAGGSAGQGQTDPGTGFRGGHTSLTTALHLLPIPRLCHCLQEATYNLRMLRPEHTAQHQRQKKKQSLV